MITDNGACYRSSDFARIVGNESWHQKTKPYTPPHKGKVEHYQRILSEELLYAQEFTSEDERAARIGVWDRGFGEQGVQRPGVAPAEGGLQRLPRHPEGGTPQELRHSGGLGMQRRRPAGAVPPLFGVPFAAA